MFLWDLVIYTLKLAILVFLLLRSLGFRSKFAQFWYEYHAFCSLPCPTSWKIGLNFSFCVSWVSFRYLGWCCDGSGFLISIGLLVCILIVQLLCWFSFHRFCVVLFRLRVSSFTLCFLCTFLIEILSTLDFSFCDIVLKLTDTCPHVRL